MNKKTAVNERVGWAYATVFTQLVHTCANFTLTFPQWYQSLVVIPLAVNLSCSQKGSYCMPIGEAEEF